MNWLRTYSPGIGFVLVPAAVATGLGTLVPLVGGPVFGIVLGMLIAYKVGKPAYVRKGISFCSKKVLQGAIVCLGAGLSLTRVWETGLESLPVMLISLAAAFIAAYGVGRLMKIPLQLQSLIGVGTAICGGSAIAAVSPIIEAKEPDIAYSVSTIFLFNIMAVLLFPALGHWLGLSQDGFGLWAGTAINDTSSVVAAGYLFGDEAGAYATIVKLARTTMIIPICLLFVAIAVFRKKRRTDPAGDELPVSLRGIFPWFIVWFLAASLLHTLGVIPAASLPYVNGIGKFMIVVALTAIGMNADFQQMIRTGFKPVLFGLIVWSTVALASIAVQFALGKV